ncbi:Protein hedgehog [Seminavis robusta]|uniref:Protein hedgehog n=1 Tax=Seminavis robusta TaxID=568900 RepID=A0A9N8DSS7_9STRA|nr:Protein hedgehog [Seminavis robusta]|eukprot:Sro316_g115610.1 Protein hedgehog (264) ;mRNA; f:70453-71244
MKNLQVGDKVLTGNKNTPYQPVYSFGHRHEHLEGTFFQIHTADKAPLEMTGSHLMFIVDDENKLQTVRADAVKVGDHVVKSRDDGVMLPSTVTEITTIRKKGMYMPLTPDGTIVVDGIVASTYVSIQDQAPAVVENSKLFPFLTEQRILHWFLSPYRMLCLGVSSNACQFLESRDEEGIHFWLVAGRKLAEFANGQGFLVQVLLIGIPVFLVFALVNLLEVLLGGPALAPFVCFATTVFGGWIVNNLQRRRMRRENNETKKLE